MRNRLEKIRVRMFDFLVFLERAKAFFLRKISILCGFSFFQIEILIDGDNPHKTKFEILERYSELENFSYIDFESGNLIGHTFQQSYHLKIADVILDSKTGILFNSERNVIAESSSYPPEYLAATVHPKPPAIALGSKLDLDRELISLSSNGYYHWLNEDLPHYLHLLKNLENPLTLVSKNRPQFVSNFLETHSIDYLEVPRFIKCSEINFISKKSTVVWPQPKDISILRNHFSVDFSKLSPGKKIYISRIGDSRSPLFEGDLIRLLENNGWTILNATKMTMNQQIKEISSAEVLAGIHGAGLSGVNWMSQGTKLVEIGTDRFLRCFQRLAIVNRIEYSRINYKNDRDGLNITVGELKKLGHL
jgi:Glycosyltransferase 61